MKSSLTLCIVFIISCVVLVSGDTNQHCPLYWSAYGNSCYRPRWINLKTWQEAQDWCQAQGADLVKIETVNERNWLVGLARNIQNTSHAKDHWWTGLNNLDPNSQSYTWGDNSPVDPRITAGQQIHPSSSEHCVSIVKPGRLRNTNCGVKNPYICERARGIPLTCDADSGWQQFNTFCYKVHTDSQNWNQAMNRCNRDGGSLVQIEGEQDEIVIHDFAKNTHSPIWIGLRSQSMGSNAVTWNWVNGTTLESSMNYWQGSRIPRIQPNQRNNTCVWMSNTQPDYHQGWRTDNCGARKHYVCKKPEGVCAPGWIPHQKKCFQFNIQFKKSWRNAEAFCKAEGGHLVALYGNTYKTFLNSYLDELREAQIDSIWIGISDNNVDTGPFRWTYGGTAARYQNWMHNPPLNHKGQLDCAYIQSGDVNGKWRPTNNCNQQKAFVCETDMDKPVKTVATPRPQYKCSTGWRLHSGLCYQFNDATQNWLYARSQCQKQSADLATIKKPDIQSFIQSQVRGKEYWIGLNDRIGHENLFVWLDDVVRSTYYHWQQNPHEPNNKNGQQNCVIIQANGFWNDKECYLPRRFICQKPATNYVLPVTPSTTVRPFSRKCGYNWEEDPNSDWCYQFHDEQMVWSDARGVCKKEGGDLASITSREEQFYIGTKVSTMNSVGVWIGAQDWSSEGGWKWMDGSPFAYLNWNPGQPDDFHHNEDCGGIFTFNTRWNDFPCSSRHGFICKKFSNRHTAAATTTLPKTPAGYTLGCPNFWHKHGGACFLVVKGGVNWLKAQTICRRNGGELASINNKGESDFISTLLPSKTNQSWDGYWIGLNDRLVDNKFQWSDGSPVVYTNWAAHEPNSWMHHNEDCVMIYINRPGWNDGVCEDTSPGFVCRRPVQVVSKTQAPEYKGCNLPARGYGSKCYTMVYTKKSWTDAQAFCKSRFHGNLATINNRFQQAFITNYLPHSSFYFWNGLSDIKVRGTYAWASGRPVRFTYWDKSHTGNEIASCVALKTTQPIGLWLNKNCSELHSFVCESARVGYTTPTTTPVPTQVPCPTGYTAFGSACYKAYRFTTAASKLTWEESRDYCRGLGGDLISIHSQAEQDFVTGTLLAGSARYSGYWIGLNDRATEAGHVWSDGSGTDYTSWSPSEPNDYNHQEDCVQIDMSTRKWNDNNCFFSMNYICKVARGVQLSTSVAPPTAATSAACGSGWLSYQNYCYMFVTNVSKSWYDARAYCNGMGSELVSIHSLDENNLILGQTSKLGRNDFWIGLNELQRHGTYVWSDGTLTDFDNWRPHEPNDAFGGERCANLNIFGGTWNDENCNSVIPFICKRLSSSATKPISTQAPPLINGGCPDPHFKPVPNSNKCYAIINMTKNWQSARDSCRHDYPGSDIASINSITEQEYLTANLQKYSFSVWIGLNKLRHNSKFYWQDNSPFSFQNWAPNEPNSAPSGGKFVRNSEECVEMYTQTAQYVGTWNDKGCQNLRPYVCQISKNAGSIVLSQQGGCPKGFINWRTSCYKYVKSSVTWSDAQTACQSLSATLVIINDVYEDGYVQSMVGCPGCGYWIGLSDQQTSGTYRWVLNWPVYFTNWGAGEPTRATGEGCVAITNNVWNDTNCASTQGYVCEINSVSPPPTTAPPIGHCADPVTQRLVGDYCYYFSRYKTATWPGASYMCQKLGMTLASIHGNDELNFIWNTFLNMHPRPNETTANSPPNVWIGMTKGLSDGFTWADNTAVNFLNWAPNEPSDPLTASNEECVELYTSSGQWNDKDCFTPRKYVCKGRALGVTTAFKLPTQNINNLPPKSSNQPIRPSFPTNPTFPTGPVNPTYPTGPVNPTFPTGPVDPGRPTTRIPYINFPTNAARQRAAPSNNGNGNSTGLSGGSLAGILISCIALLIVVAFGLIFLKRRQSPPVSGPAGGFDNKMYFSTAKNSVQTGGGNSNSGFDDADA